MLVSWKRRTSVLIGDDLIITRVKLRNDTLHILVNESLNEWSHFSLKKYNVCFMKNLKCKHQIPKDDILSANQHSSSHPHGHHRHEPHQSPALMILYERTGVIAMSIVLKNIAEMELLSKSLEEHSSVSVTLIDKNTYLEEKFINVRITDLLPEDYFQDAKDTHRSHEASKHNSSQMEYNSNVSRFQSFLELMSELKTKKVLLNYANGCQIFGFVKNFQHSHEKIKPELSRPEIPSTLLQFLRGYLIKLRNEYDVTTIAALLFLYFILVMLSVFTMAQLLIFTIGVIFAVAKFDLHLHRIKQNRIAANIHQKPAEIEAYAKKMISFHREELSEFLKDRFRRIKLSVESGGTIQQTSQSQPSQLLYLSCLTLQPVFRNPGLDVFRSWNGTLVPHY